MDSSQAGSVGGFVHHVGRPLFIEGRYDELDRELETFWEANTAGTVTQSKNTFFRQSLPGLICNYVFPEYGDFSGQVTWLEEFPRIIALINPMYADTDGSLSDYLSNCSRRRVPMGEIIAEVVTSIKAFIGRHPEFAK
ncbi:hypothetical protein [Geomonas subterranea]|uniref:hypothetical protein n=1 Tax=Geomonas subterranea TaxID=2847989 RepID=UPI001CD40E8A|nr:hypothetical protein [Geomonas fuzhouensis]